MMLWAAEMQALPSHLAHDPFVNGTNYFRLVADGYKRPGDGVPFAGPQGERPSLDEALSTDKTLADPNYVTPIIVGTLMMLVLSVLHNVVILVLLHRGRAWVKATSGNTFLSEVRPAP